MSRVETLYKVTKTHWRRAINSGGWSEWTASKIRIDYQVRIEDVKFAQTAARQQDDLNERWPDRAWEKYTVDVEYAEMPVFKPYVS